MFNPLQIKSGVRLLLLFAALCLPWLSQAQTTCQIKIVGEDGYGDAWNGGSLAVVQNGTTITTFYALNADDGGMEVGAFDSTFVTVTSGIPVSFVWTSGSYDEEVTIWIYDGGGTMVYTVNEPTAGTIYTMNTPCPSCIPPQGLAATVTDSDVDITWTAGTATDWQIVWGTGSFNPDTVTVNIDYPSTASYSLTNLDDGQYTAYVRTDCGTDTSAWVSVHFNIGITLMNMAANGSDTLRSCNAIIYDNGGPNGDYSASCQSTLVIYPSDETSWVTISGSSYTESTYDYITIYDGVGTAGEQLWTDNGIDALTNFGPFSSSAITVTFYSDGSVQRSGFQINVSCLPAPDCDRPLSFSVSDVATDSVYLAWVDANGSEWSVTYGPAGFTPGDANSSYESFTDTYAAIGNLTPNTTYDFYLRTLCSNGDSSMTRMVSVRTACTDIDSLPYIYGFEDASTGGSSTTSPFAADCWIRLNNGTSYGGYPYISSTSTYCHSGSRGLYWYNSTTMGSYGDYQCLVLPGVNTTDFPVNGLMLKFWAKASTDSYQPQFQVGVMTNPNDINSFTTVASVDVVGTTWTEYEAFLAGYQGTGRYVAIRALRPASSWYAYVDDFTLDLLPSCPHVASISLDSASSDYLGISWVPAGDESEWLIYLNDSIIGTASDTLYDITDLQLNTVYSISVAALCGDGDTSSLISISGRTLAGDPISDFPYICGFEINQDDDSDESVDWVFENGSQANYWMVGNATNNGGSRSMYITNDGSSNAYTNSTTTYVFAYATFAFDAGEYAFSYDWKANGESSFDFIRAAVVPNTVEFTAGSYCGFNNTSGVPAGGIAIDGAYRLNGQSNWQNQTGTFTIANAGIYKVVFLWRNDGSGGTTPPAAIDNIMISLNTCPAPANLVSAYASTDSVIISWQPVGTETQWEVTYGSVVDVVTDTFYVAESLSPNTDYSFSVRAICSESDTSLPVSVNVRTDCGAISVLPYIESFEGLPAGTSSNLDCGVPCWGRLDNASTYHFGYIGSPSSWPSGGHTGTGFLYYYMPTTTGTYADWIITILPPVDVTTYPINTLQLSFWVKMNSATTQGDIQVGVISNTNDASTFIPLDTVHVAGNVYDLKTAYLTNYVDTANATHIALKYFRNPSTTTYYFVDDVTVEPIPDCPPVSDITLAGLTSDSLYVTWTENGNATSWSVEYGPTNFTLGTGTTEVVTSLPMEIGNLTANTAYDVYVTPECNDGVSATRMATLRTDCGPTPVPFTETFDTWSSTVADPLPNCWEKHTNYSSNYPYASTSQYHGTGGKSMYMYSTASTYCYMVLPSFALPIDSTMVSFWLYSSSTSYNLEVGVMNDPADVSTFTTVATVTPSSTSTWEEIEVPLTSYTGTGTRIAIMSPNGITSYPYLDDLTVSRISDCPRVNQLAVPNVTLDSALVVWTDPVGTAWNVEYDTVPFTPGTGVVTPILVTDTFCVLSGLDSGTVYYVYVYPDCGDDVSERAISFSTLAASPATVPYSCDFEASGVNGWDLLTTGQTNYWMVGNATSNGGTQSLYVTNNGSANAYTNSSISYSYAVRTFHLSEVGEYAYSYDWKGMGESHYYDFTRVFITPASEMFSAGTVLGGSTYNFASASCPANWIELTQSGATPNTLAQSSSWQTVIGTFSIAAPGNYKMVFVWANDGSGGSNPPTAIDNVSLLHNDCPAVNNVAAGYVTIDSAIVSWSSSDDHTSFLFEYDSVPFSAGNGSYSFTVNDTAYTMTGLSAGVTYYVIVRALCNTDTALAAGMSFTTLAALPATVPYSCDFEASGVNGWDLLNGSEDNYWIVGNATNNGGSRSLYVTDNGTSNSYSGSESFVFATRAFNLTAGDYICSYDWKCQGESSFDFLRAALVPASANIEAGSYCGFSNSSDLPSGAIALDGAYRMNQQSSWTTHSDEFTLTTPGIYKLVFLWRNDGSIYNMPPAAIDNVQLLPNTCPIPTNLTSTAAGTTYITVDWSDPASSTPQGWEVRYNDGTTTTSFVTTTHPVNISNLSALSVYNVSVRAICGAGDTSAWCPFEAFSTAMCDNATEVLVGDSSMTTTTSYYVPVNNYYNYTLTEFIIDSAELGDITEITAMSFYYSYSSPSTVKTDVDIYLMHTTDAVFASTEDLHVVDTSSTATNPAVLVYSGPLNCVQGWNVFGLNAPFAWDGHSNIMVVIDDNSGDYDGSSYIFTARNCNGNKTLNWYSDSDNPDPTNSTYSGSKYLRTYRPEMRLISCGISCPKPTALPATDVTYHSATVNWNSNATDFEVAVKAATDATWPAETVVSNATSFAVDNLAPATAYQFRVRAICDAAENLISDWAEGTFVTDSLPCFDPTDLHTTAIGYTTATLAWTADASQNQWNIRVWTPANGTDFEVTTNPYTVTGLVPHTTYYAAVKAICGGGAAESEYSDTIEFTTETCVQVTGVSVSQITANSAVVSWNAVSAVKYEIEYGDRNFNQGTGTTIVVNDGTSYTLTGLLPDYDYSVFVRAYCEENVDGAWSDQVDFTTPQQGGGEGLLTVDGTATLSIFPNPTTDATTIAISGVTGEVEITIVDMNGRTVATETMSCEGDCTKRMEVNSLAQGAYFVRISADSINLVRKLIIK